VASPSIRARISAGIVMTRRDRPPTPAPPESQSKAPSTTNRKTRKKALLPAQSSPPTISGRVMTTQSVSVFGLGSRLRESTRRRRSTAASSAAWTTHAHLHSRVNCSPNRCSFLHVFARRLRLKLSNSAARCKASRVASRPLHQISASEEIKQLALAT